MVKMDHLRSEKPLVLIGDCLELLAKVPDTSIDLIITSPPYADQRKSTYGGITPDNYAAWFSPRAREFFRVLRPTGSFVLNIKERVVNGERSTYVIDLIQMLRAEDWRWTEEYIWHKKNCYPGKWPNRFRDAWERLLHFTKQKNFKMFQNAVRVPMGDWKQSRLKNLSATDKIRDESKAQSGFGKNISNWLGRDQAYPTNVLTLATECANKNHSATFPESLPDWFIRLFTEKNDVVLDPFAGSGTTLVAAKKLERKSIGIEIMPEYESIILERLGSASICRDTSSGIIFAKGTGTLQQSPRRAKRGLPSRRAVTDGPGRAQRQMKTAPYPPRRKYIRRDNWT